MTNKNEFKDDNRVIADMSMIEKPSFMGTLFGRRFDKKEKPAKAQEFSKEDRKAYVFGAMGASLVLVLIYAVIFAAAIGLIILLFKMNSWVFIHHKNEFGAIM